MTDIQSIIHAFVKRRKVVVYGGAAINAMVPESAKFYGPDTPMDWDMLCDAPQLLSMSLADLLHAAGHRVKVINGLHFNTFRVMVDRSPVADFTYTPAHIFESLWAERKVLDGIPFAHPNFLRLAAYLELSHPKNFAERWVKVIPRLSLLNKYHPVKCQPAYSLQMPSRPTVAAKLVDALEEFLVDSDIIVLGLNASSLHLAPRKRKIPWTFPIDLLAADPADSAQKLHEILTTHVGLSVRAVMHKTRTDVVPDYTDMMLGDRLLARVYATTDCHSYHQLSNGIKLGSLPTILQFVFVNLYMRPSSSSPLDHQMDVGRMLCTAQALVDAAEAAPTTHRRYEVLTPDDCIGEASTFEEAKRARAEMHKQVKGNRFSDDFLKFYFFFDPARTKEETKKSLMSRLKYLYGRNDG